MADIHLEKKKSRGGMMWLWLLLAGLVAAAFIAWIALDDDDAEVEQTAEVEREAQPEPQAAEQQQQQEGIAVGAILQDPASWEGRTVSGEIAVESVPTDRGFWIEEGGQRLFVVLDPEHEETPYEVEAENRVHIRQATVRGSEYRDQISGQLTEETRNILQGEEVFLLADGPDVQLLAAR